MAFDTLGTAREVVLNSSVQTFSGSVSSTNLLDYYRIQLEGRSSLQVSLTGLSGNANVEIVQDINRNNAIESNEALFQSINGNGISELINTPLNAGVYFIRVSTSASSTNYSLNLSAISNTQTDLVWRNTQTGENMISGMIGSVLDFSGSTLRVSDLNWQIAATSDFNNDGKLDFVWRNRVTGENAIWLMNGTTLLSGVMFTSVGDRNWQIVGAGDFNNDAQSDIVWRNSVTGENAIWLMNGTSLQSGVMFTSVGDRNWQIVGTGDFSSDGKLDLVWRNRATGENAIWLMNGTNLQSGVMLTRISDLNWQIIDTAEFNNDGRTDLVWRNTATGENAFWLMNGTNLISGATFINLTDTRWQMVGAAKRFDEPPIIDAVGNSRFTAFNVGNPTTAVMFREALHSSDTEDFYQFSINEFSDVTVILSGLTVGASIQILDSNGSVLQTASATGAVNQQISLSINSGQYFARVFHTSGSGVYKLDLFSYPQPAYHYNFTYYYNGQNTSQDYYTGYVTARIGAYNSGQFYDVTGANNETGANGRYLITGIRGNGSVADLGKVFVETYYDVDSSASSFTPLKFSEGQAAGTNYLGSEFDRIGSTNSSDGFGEDAAEADGIYLYRFRYYFNGSLAGTEDYYDGTVVARVGAYLNLQFHDAVNRMNEAGFNGRYFILSGTPFTDPNPRSQLGRVTLTNYYDSETNQSYTPTGSGQNYLGSEIGWLRTVQNDTERFGEDFTEADARQITGVSIASSLRQGMSTAITWSDNISENVRVDLMQGGFFHSTLIGSTESDGRFDWTPLNFAIANNYQIRLTSLSDSSIVALSNQFSLTSSGSLTITTPNGGNLLRPGSNHSITWTDDISENVVIELYKGNALHTTIVSSTASDGEHTWTLPSIITNGNDFRIRIASLSNIYVSDWSDGFFRIEDLGDPGNTMNSAEGQTAAFSRSQQVSSGDRDDFYRFSVSQSGVFTANLTGLSGDADVQLIQDINNNGTVDSGEILAWQWERLNNNESIRRFLSAGNYFVRVLSHRDQTANYSISTNFTPAANDDRRFAIQISFGSGSEFLSAAMRDAVQTAARFWERVISHSSTNSNHTLTIEVGGSQQEWGSRRVLASAGYSLPLNSSQLPVTGSSNINTHPDAVRDLSADIDYFTRVMIHEFGHVMGLGTLWSNLINIATSSYNSNTYAGWAYGELRGRYEQQAIPLTNNVGAGSDYSHWREEIFTNELMTHAANRVLWGTGADMPLSHLTIASLRDIGWNVNYGAAEAYTLTNSMVQASTGSMQTSEFAVVCGCMQHLSGTRSSGLNTIGQSQLADLIQTA